MGHRIAISPHRALVLDAVHFARGVPFFPVEQTFSLAEVARLRRALPIRISWTALFVKAHACVVAKTPQLRRVFVPWPWAHFYEQTTICAAVAIQREHAGEDRLCWGRFHEPQASPLVEIQASLDRYQHEPVERVFRRQVRFSKLPAIVRRAAWRIGLYLDVGRRAKRFGTFSVSSLAGQQTLNRFHPSIHTTSLTYGPVDDRGECLVTLLCDHRVLDGVAAARALSQLHATMRGTIAEELRTLACVKVAA